MSSQTTHPTIPSPADLHVTVVVHELDEPDAIEPDDTSARGRRLMQAPIPVDRDPTTPALARAKPPRPLPPGPMPWFEP